MSAHVGDKVKVMETRPLSKDKRWRLVEVIENARSKEVPIYDPGRILSESS